MIPDVVVDVGNTRIKWGLCSAEGVTALASLPPDDPAAWEGQARSWGLTSPRAWVVALGGAANVRSVDACTTRLRLIVARQTAVNVATPKQLGARGVVRPSDERS